MSSTASLFLVNTPLLVVCCVAGVASGAMPFEEVEGFMTSGFESTCASAFAGVLMCRLGAVLLIKCIEESQSAHFIYIWLCS